jgi:hypothetical protein
MDYNNTQDFFVHARFVLRTAARSEFPGLVPAVNTLLASNNMQLVPIIPQPRVGVEDSLEVQGIAAVKRAKPVQERTLPPLLTQPHEPPLQLVFEVYGEEGPQRTQLAERRIICRRLHHLSILEELRSAIDRRKRIQRGTDFSLHIDVEV